MLALIAVLFVVTLVFVCAVAPNGSVDRLLPQIAQIWGTEFGTEIPISKAPAFGCIGQVLRTNTPSYAPLPDSKEGRNMVALTGTLPVCACNAFPCVCACENVRVEAAPDAIDMAKVRLSQMGYRPIEVCPYSGARL